MAFDRAVSLAQRCMLAVEAFVFAHRRLALLVIPALLLLLGVAAVRAPEADRAGSPPVAIEPGAAVGGDQEVLRVALVRLDGEIYDSAFLVHLARLTDALAALPGVGARRVHSLFSADARFIDVVDARYYAAALAPPALREAATPELLARSRTNLVKAQALGRWVSGDGRGALIEIELAPGAAAPAPQALQQLIAEELAAPVATETTNRRIAAYVAGPALDRLAAQQRQLRSLPALLLAWLLLGATLWLLLGHVASLMAPAVAVLPVLAMLAAGRWRGASPELAELLAGFVLSLALNVRFVSAWLAAVAVGGPSFDASLGVWRRLAGGSVLAVIAAAVAFATLALLPFDGARTQALALLVGALFALLGERLLLPVLLSRLRLRDPLRLSMRIARRAVLAAPLSRGWTALARPDLTVVLLTVAATVLGWSLWQRQGLEIGAGRASEPAGQLIARAFPLAVNRLWIRAEADPWSCAQPQTLDQVDRLAWKLDNTRGVLATQAMPGVVRQIHTAFAEGSPKFAVLPRRRDMLIQAIAPLAPELQLGNADCSLLPVWVATDGRAETTARIAAVVDAFERDNAAEFFDSHRQLDPAACHSRPAPARPAADAGSTPDAQAGSMDCPVHFAIGGGPLAVAAAQSGALAGPAKALLWAALAAALLALGTALRSGAAAAAILFGVAVAALFLEAALAVRGVALQIATLPLVVIAVGLGAAFAAPLWLAMAQPARAGPGAVPEGVSALAATALALGVAAVVLLSPLAGLDQASRWFWFVLAGALAVALLLLPVLARLALAEQRAQSSAAPSGRRY